MIGGRGAVAGERPMDETHLLSERIERAMISELHAAAPGPVRDALGLSLETVGGAVASVAAGDPSILLNRAIGLGVEAPASREAPAALKAHYAAAGVGRYFVHVHPEAEPPELRNWLEAEGFTAYRRWAKFVRGREAPPAPESDLRVEPIGPKHAQDFGWIVAGGFDLTAAAGEAVAALVGRRGWHLYMTFAGDAPAGTGALYVHEDAGWLDFGATDPAHRRRGSQRALLARRVADALDLGCRVLFTETGEAVEGDPQHSYHNIEWAGFRPAVLRDNYVPSR